MNISILSRLKQSFLVAFLFLSIFFISTAGFVYAGDYGRGDFNKGNYGQGQDTSSSGSSSSDNSGSSSTSTPSCQNQSPGNKAPWLYGAIAQGGSSIMLYFTEADTPVNHYVLQYGTKPGEYQYGIQDLGVNERHQMTFLVQSLAPNTTYYFKIRGGNGCATGPWSNEISATTKGILNFRQLNMTSELVPQETTKATTEKENTGQEGSSSEKATDTTEETTPEGYDVNVKVLDTDEKPVEGAEVTLHSTPRKATTDKNGVASFNDVEAGDHKVYIAYDGYEGEQSLNLSGDVKEFSLNVTIERKNVIFSKVSVAIIVLLSLLVAGMTVWIVRMRRK